VDSSLLIQVVAGSVMEGASMMFHRDYNKRCLLTILVSQILLLTQLISEIKKSTTAKGFFSTLYHSLTFWEQKLSQFGKFDKNSIVN